MTEERGRLKDDERLTRTSLVEIFEMDLVELTKHLTIKHLLALGRIGAATDYAVRFYYNKQHPKFHKNRAALETAVRRAWSTSFRFYGERMARYLLQHEDNIKQSLKNKRR